MRFFDGEVPGDAEGVSSSEELSGDCDVSVLGGILIRRAVVGMMLIPWGMWTVLVDFLAFTHLL